MLIQKIFTYFSIVLFCIFFIATNDARALSVSVDKPVVELSGLPGSIVSDKLVIKNKDIDAIVVKIDPYDWAIDEIEGASLEVPGSTKYSCANWLSITPTELMVPPDDQRDITITARIPENAVGGYYAALSIESVPTKVDRSGITAQIVAQLIVRLNVEVEGKTNKTGMISSFKVFEPTKNKPLLVKYVFENQGNTFLSTFGTINIMDKSGNVYGTATSQKRRKTFPGGKAEEIIEWFGSIPKGDYDVVLTVNMGNDVLPLVEKETINVKEDIE